MTAQMVLMPAECSMFLIIFSFFRLCLTPHQLSITQQPKTSKENQHLDFNFT